MSRHAIKDLKECLRIYYTYPEIGISEIRELFGVGETKAWRLKETVRKKQFEENVIVFDKTNINTELAFKVWGIDIDDIERRVKKLEKLGLYPMKESKAI